MPYVLIFNDKMAFKRKKNKNFHLFCAIVKLEKSGILSSFKLLDGFPKYLKVVLNIC